MGTVWGDKARGCCREMNSPSQMRGPLVGSSKGMLATLPCCTYSLNSNYGAGTVILRDLLALPPPDKVSVYVYVPAAVGTVKS